MHGRGREEEGGHTYMHGWGRDARGTCMGGAGMRRGAHVHAWAGQG